MPNPAPPPGDPNGTNALVQQLRTFFGKALSWVIMSRTGTIGPARIVINADGNVHPVDANAKFLVSALNFRNRTGNAGTFFLGNLGDQFISLPAGLSVSPQWTYPSEWYYKVTGSASTDVYECWWTG